MPSFFLYKSLIINKNKPAIMPSVLARAIGVGGACCTRRSDHKRNYRRLRKPAVEHLQSDPERRFKAG